MKKRKYNNRRWAKNERSIRVTYIKSPELNAKNLAKLANVSRFTLHRHHKNLQNIANDYYKYLEPEFKKFVQGKNTSLEHLYQEVLIFIIRYAEFFQVIVIKDGVSGFYFLLDSLQPDIEKLLNLPKNSAEIWRVYKSMVAEIILMWFEKYPQAGADDFEKVARKIASSSRAARTWLVKFVG